MTNPIQKRYDRIAGIYDIVEYPMEMMFSRWRRKLLQEAGGRVLEVGIGTGRSIPYYPEGVELTGIDFSEKMIKRARKKAEGRSNIFLEVMDAEKMQFENNRFDTVVTSCVFCSVPDAVRGLKEIRRVCKPGGKILMLEHVRSNRKIAGPLMDMVNPLPLNIYGANINRRTYENLLKAGFDPADISQEDLWADIVKFFRIVNNK